MLVLISSHQLVIYLINVDTSKRRHIIRSKLARLKEKERLVICDYLRLKNRENDKELFENLQKGLFDWRSNFEQSTGNIIITINT